jgi:hypothetical protein
MPLEAAGFHPACCKSIKQRNYADTLFLIGHQIGHHESLILDQQSIRFADLNDQLTGIDDVSHSPLTVQRSGCLKHESQHGALFTHHVLCPGQRRTP